ncbi:MAG: SusC/RagA family TonB-linked outer membrane protein [Muribaculaceae bacterium]|nr:SusC/RagA family TonB-linked outer membrane protein [Muribaculaceae bacterium]
MKHSYKSSKKMLRPVICASVVAVMGLGTPAVAQTADAAKSAQEKVDENTLSGVVIDSSTGQPLPGARVAVVDAKAMAMTDDDGKFNLKLPADAATLRVEAPGFATILVPLRGQKDLTIRLGIPMEGDIYKNALTADAHNDRTEFAIGQTVSDNSVADLQGDLYSISRSGMPGAGHAVYIEGLHSINSSSQPLYVVDGVIWSVSDDNSSIMDGHFDNPLALISPDDIENIYVMKNGTAIYGAKGGNGVVIIETKRAKSEATEIEAYARVGWRHAAKTIPMMNADQYRTYASDIIKDKYENQIVIDRLGFLNDDPTSSQYYDTHNNTNWLDLVTRDGLMMNYGVNVRGGDDRALYMFSLGYTQNEGTVKETSFDRINVRFNSDINLWRGSSLRFDVAYAQDTYKLRDDGMNAYSSPYYIAMIKSPLYHPNILALDGSLTSKYADKDELDVTNPMEILDMGIGESRNYRFNLNAAPRYRFNDALTVEGLVAYTFNKIKENSFVPDYGVDERDFINSNGEIYATSRNVVKSLMTRHTTFIADLHFFYNPLRTIEHKLSFTGGFRYQNDTYVNSVGEGHNTPSDFINDLGNTTSSLHFISGHDFTWRNMAWYLSGEYAFLQRYILNFDGVMESNSRFGKNAPGAAHIGGVSWGLFPSVTAAWLMSSEKWMNDVRFLDLFKIRASFDMAGNDKIPFYANRTYFASEALNNNGFGQVIANIGNDRLKWETTRTWRFGFDASLFANRWTMAFDFYTSKTSDLLIQKRAKDEVGLEYYWSNGGDLSNKGINFSTTVRAINLRDWKLDIGANIGHYKNKITSLPEGQMLTDICGGQVLTAVGNPVGVFYGYKADGVFSSVAEAQAANLSIRNSDGSLTPFEAGDMRFIDSDGNGVITEADRGIIGDPNPDIFGNFNLRLTWKNFTLGTVFTYSVGNDAYNALRAQLEAGDDIFNQTTAMLNRWVANGQVTDVPRAVYEDPMGNGRFSNRWIEDASYLKWKSLSLDYRIPISSPYIQGVTLSFAVNNLCTWTKYLGADPEFAFGNSPLYLGVDAGMVPQAREFNFGVKVNL